MVSFEAITKAVTEGDGNLAYELTKSALDADVSPNDILDKGLIPGLQVVGDQFENGDFFLPELIVAGDAVSKALELLDPVLGKEGWALKGKFLIGTVKGDLHDIGKNLVMMMLEGGGFKVIDLGIDVASDKFIAAAEDNSADIVAMSALLTTTMPAMEATVAAIKDNGLQVKIMVGGAPVNWEFSDRIGADGHSDDAPGAVSIAREFMGLGSNPD
ncbi:MAG: corrinoid protein [Desulfobacterales bacterium]